MAILPQIDNSIENNTSILQTQLPSKTYKLTINDSTDLIYSEDASNIVLFKFENGNLVGYTQSENRTIDFTIENGNLIAISNNEKLLDKFSIEDYYLMLDTEYYSDRIIGYVDNIEAVKQSIYHILATERYAYLIYDENYGVELEQYIGQSIDYLATTIETTLREALTHDLRILDVIVENIYQINSDTVLVQFTARTIYGDLVLEVNVNV